MNKIEIIRQGNQISNQFRDEIIQLFGQTDQDDDFKMSRRAETIKSEMEHKYKFRWNIILHSLDNSVQSSFVFSEEFLLELKSQDYVLLAYIIPDQPTKNYEPRRDFGVGQTKFQEKYDKNDAYKQYIINIYKYIILRNELIQFIVLILMYKILNKFQFSSISPISDDLLLSVAMAHQNKQANSQLELSNQFTKTISPYILEKFAILDRKYFQGNYQIPQATLYSNAPIKLNNIDNMTTPFMHLLVVDQIYRSNPKKDFTFLDIGTGRGYIPFLLKLCFPESSISGIDINNKLIDECKSIQQTLGNIVPNCSQIQFKHVNGLIGEDKFDYINVGFAVNAEQKQNILANINQYLLCPVIDGNEQWFCKIDKLNQETKIMKCVFQQGQQEMRASKIEIEQKIKIVEQEIKDWQLNFKKIYNRRPNVEDMSKDQQLQELLKQLKVLKFEVKLQ